MPVVLLDANIEGHGMRIWTRMQSPMWRELTEGLDVRLQTFRELGIDPASPDGAIWRLCQTRGFYLLTSNRNEESDDALEATIRREGLLTSLPVFTLPRPDRVFTDQAFLDRAVEKLLDYLLFAEDILGTGRLYLP